MRIVGYLLAIAGLALLYTDSLIPGIVSFTMGGFFAKGLFVSLKSLAMVVGVFTAAYGYHNEFTSLVIIVLIVCILLVFFHRKRRDIDAEEWGFEWDFGDFFGSDGDSGDGGGD